MGNCATGIRSRWNISLEGETRIINEWKFKFLKTQSFKTSWKSPYIPSIRIETWKRRARKKEKWSFERVIRRIKNQWISE